ncbi:MAG: response regulator [Tissierellales bacterium]|nr:response regulator [Tissierellales bacterium]
MKVLIADDAAFMRMMIRNILEENGIEVIGEASNGKEAVERYKELSPDLVTMDITMPVKNGIDAIKDIRAFDSKAKILACSAMGQESMVIEAIKGGAQGFIVKPFQADKLILELTKLYEK